MEPNIVAAGEAVQQAADDVFAGVAAHKAQAAFRIDDAGHRGPRLDGRGQQYGRAVLIATLGGDAGDRTGIGGLAAAAGIEADGIQYGAETAVGLLFTGENAGFPGRKIGRIVV